MRRSDRDDYDNYIRYYERESAIQNAGSAVFGIFGFFMLIGAAFAPGGLATVLFGGALISAILSKLLYRKGDD